MVSLKSIGKAVGIAADVAGIGSSVAGFFGGTPSAPKAMPPKEQIKYQLRLQRKSILQELPTRMAAATKAGVHPLVALGMQPSGGASIQFGQDSAPVTKDLAAAGQNLSSSLYKAATQEERDLGLLSARQAVQRGDLENEKLKAEIASIRASITPPPLNPSSALIPGQAQSAGRDLALVPKEVLRDQGDGTEAGRPPAIAYANYKGSPIRVRGKALTDAGMEEGLASMIFDLTNTVPDIAEVEARRFLKFINQPEGVKLRYFINKLKGGR